MRKLASLAAVIASSSLAVVGCSESDTPDVPETTGDGDVTDPVGDGDGDDPSTGGAGGGGGEVTEDGPMAEFIMGGLGTAGEFSGYLFTASEAGSSIAPAEFLGSVVCAQGEVAADWEEWAMIGWNVAQEINEDFSGGDTMEITPTSSGIRVKAQNNGVGYSLRVQIQGLDETKRWCAKLDNDGSELLWTDFKTECWLPSGGVEAFDPSVDKLAQIAIQVPAASETTPTPYDFCLIDIEPFDE